MKRRLAAILLGAALLCGCASTAPDQRTRVTPAAIANEAALPREMIFLVDSAGDPVYRQAAEMFALKAAQLSDGALNIQVLTSMRPVADFNEGKARFTFVDSRQDSKFSTDFPTLNLPLLYGSYQRITMGLNDPRVLSAVSDTTWAGRRATMLGAFYYSSNQLISNRPPVEGGLPTIDEDQPLGAAVRPDSGAEALLTAYGLEVTVVPDAALRTQRLLDGDVMVAEFSPEELRATDWQDYELYLLRTNHSLSPRFLTVDSNLYEQLSPAYKACLQEAMAYMFPVIDGYYLDQEAALLENLRSQGVNVTESFPALRKTAELLIAEEATTDHRKKYLIDLLTDIG